MPRRHRSGPARPLTSEQLLAVLDRFYDLEADEPTWLRGLGEVVRPLVDCGAGVTVHRLTLSTHPTAGGQIALVGLGTDIEAMWLRFCGAVPLDVLADPWMTGPLTNADRCPTPRVRSYAAVGHAAMGVGSFTAINGTDLEHRVVGIGVPVPRGAAVFWPERDRDVWECISAHLGAAFRMRGAASVREPDLIVDERGRTQHVAPGLAGTTLSALRDAMAAVDRARRIRMTPEAVLDAWRALYSGGWSIVTSIERDGRRLLVARPNAPLPHEDAAEAEDSTSRRQPARARSLSAQERRVLTALAKGHSNKLIAYELGVTTSTVATLLARAARKLGCTDRVTLARAGRTLTADEQP